MPHQLAVRSGVIKPRYPSAPRQWVTYAGEQPTGAGGGLAPPRLGTGIQRDFSRGWAGDRESQFPRLDAFSRAAVLGSLGKVLSQSLRDQDEGGSPAQTPTPPPLPTPPAGPPPEEEKVAGTGVAPYAGRRHYAYERPVGGDDDEVAGELPSGQLGLPSGPAGLPRGPFGVLEPPATSRSPLDTGPGMLPATSRTTDETTALPAMEALRPDMVYAGGARPPQQQSFVSPALASLQASVGGQGQQMRQPVGPRRPRGINPRALQQIRDDLAEFSRYKG